jgi:hypothetical protein
MATTNSPINEESILETLKQEYLFYLTAQDRHDIAAVEACMSPSCFQIARQDLRWNLPDRDAIMHILTFTRNLDDSSEESERERGRVEMRALTSEEKDTLPEELDRRKEEEGWVGMYVELEDKDENGRVVRVRYWWKLEEGRWVQCLHDLLWVGSRRDGGVNDVAAIFGVTE